ncbi:MAG: hypothetical protein GY810_08110 [Aureispira sp.]|nr:hypothetical protein [Aureispira sp.]
MRKLSNIFSLAIIAIAIFSFASCNSDCNCDGKGADGTSVANSPFRGNQDQDQSFRKQLVKSLQSELTKLKEVESFTFTEDMLPEGINLSDINTFSLTESVDESADRNAANQQADAEATELVYSVYNSLLVAENKAAQLEVEFSMSDEPVDNGVFLFSIGSEQEQDLIFEMYDEEGFEIQANNSFKINAGNNYKALNVKDLENGFYLFRLKNQEEGKELVRRVEVKK